MFVSMSVLFFFAKLMPALCHGREHQQSLEELEEEESKTSLALYVYQ